MNRSVLFLLAACVLSGCANVQTPEESAEDLQYRQCFEAGRRAESRGDTRIAGDTYGWLVGRDNRYGEYGLAMLLLRREPGSREAVKHLLSCAKRSSRTDRVSLDSTISPAFSAAAIAKLADIAESEHDRPDVAASLHDMAFHIITPQVRAWAEEMKADADYAAIYGDIISAVDSCRPGREHVKEFKWSEIVKVFLKEEPDNAAKGKEDGRSTVAGIEGTGESAKGVAE